MSKPFSFVHTADLHLDSPFVGISEINDSISSKLTESTFKSFNKIINICIEKQVDFLLVAGDIFNSADRSIRAQLRFRDGIKKLSDCGISAYIAHGNHDHLNGWSAKLDWPEKTHIFSGRSVQKFAVEKEQETIACIHGISFQKRNVTENLAHKFPKKGNDNPFTIGLLHCNLGSNTEHQPYAPCTLKDLTDLNYDYWALGHIHKKSVISTEPMIIYPGNPQGLNPTETGERGCFLVSVDSRDKPQAEFIETSSVKWFTEEIDIASLSSDDELIVKIKNRIDEIREKAGRCSAVCRIIFTGRGSLHSTISRENTLKELLDEINDESAGENFVWTESLHDETKPAIDRQALLKREDFIGEVVRLFDKTLTDKSIREETAKALDDLMNKREAKKYLQPFDDGKLKHIVKKAEIFCLDRLLGDRK
jgi:DNA repair protein SbcD/Mre11